MHANDKLYCLDVALRLAEQHCTERNVIEDLRELRDEAQRDARK